MTKIEFIEQLTQALAHLPGQERIRVLEYFEEMIDDRIESGMSEEDAVAAMGSIEDILKEATPDALNTMRETAPEKAADPSAKFSEFHSPVEAVIANSASAELHVLTAELPEGVTARVDWNLSEDEECICSLENGTLKIQHKNQKHRGFFLRNLFSAHDRSITITLANATLVHGEFRASSGDIDLNSLVFTNSLEVQTASGNLDAHDIAVQCNCNLHTASGDITATNLTCGDICEIHTVSGDIDLSDVRAGRIGVGTASGDPSLGNIECDALTAKSASGDLDLHGIKADKIVIGSSSGDLTLSDAICSRIVEMSSSSGDIEIQNTQCGQEIRLSSTSGDIRGRLIPVEDYRYSARSRTGDVKVPHYEGSCPVEIHTTSGDITFKAY